ncbi:trigger factor [Bowdeniella nasicola]|uniref:Trigger factor n=1 Tax=Bowdeniella nasicola TaxID=208480 RepID=A0A1Q5Q3W9_9ACTO|nr:trigger factor [Bowdeniella nasicola]OKL54516.1 trigger factor [Bowdeniella nasicola]
MKTEVENLEPTRVKLTVEAPYEEIAPAIDKAYREVAAQINIPGFRKGKAPKQIIDQRVGRGVVLEQAVNEVLPQLYRDAVIEQEIQVLSQPTIDVTEIPNATGELGGKLAFTAEVDVRPEIEFPNLSGVELEVETATVTDEDVEEKLTELRQRFGSLVGVDRAIQDGDFVTIDLKADIDDEEIDSVSGVSYEVGSGSMLEGMDEALIGASAGEEKTFTTKLLGGEHAGEEATCTITATAVKERDLPEADDEFAELASEFDTIDELREDLRVQAEKDAASQQALAAGDKLLDHLRETVEFPLPAGVIDAEVAEHLAQEGKDADDEHGKEIRGDIESELRDQLLLDALADKHEVGVEQNELIEFMMMTAQQYGIDPNQFFSGAAEAGQIPAFMAEIRRNKSLIAALKDVTVKDEDGTTLDLSAFLGEDTAEEQDDADESTEDETK